MMGIVYRAEFAVCYTLCVIVRNVENVGRHVCGNSCAGLENFYEVLTVAVVDTLLTQM